MAVRPLTHPLLLSTLPHACAACVAFYAGASAYGALVLLSTALSVVWHRRGEPRQHWTFWADYGVAAAWTLVDFYLALGRSQTILLVVLLGNGVVIASNHAVDALAKRGLVSYEAGHTGWHLISCLKAVGVAHAVTRS